MITSGLNAADDTADCSDNLNSTKSTDGSAGTLTALTAGSEEDSTVEIYASSRSRRCNRRMTCQKYHVLCTRRFYSFR